MKEQFTITTDEAAEVIGLIYEYVTQGGSGFDSDKLNRVGDALRWANRIEIVPEGELDGNA